MHFRPSGIRAKRPTYLPALVAITQTSIVGPRERRLSPRETARLQGLPDTFVFPDQPAAATYKQMGNGVASERSSTSSASTSSATATSSSSALRVSGFCERWSTRRPGRMSYSATTNR